MSRGKILKWENFENAQVFRISWVYVGKYRILMTNGAVWGKHWWVKETNKLTRYLEDSWYICITQIVIL